MGATRLAVIEVGSRAVRLLIADADRGCLELIKTASKPVNLQAALRDGDNEAMMALEAVREQISHFRKLAANSGAERVACIGTAAAREVMESGTSVLAKFLDGVQVLSEKEEAEYSFVACGIDPAIGISSSTRYLAVDLGGGSAEVMSGAKQAQGPAMEKHVSLSLGTMQLIEKFNSCGRELGAFDKALEAELDASFIAFDGKFSAACLMGSFPTKAAWLKKRPSLEALYDPRIVGGTSLSRNEIALSSEQIYTLWCRSPEETAGLIDARSKDSSETLMMICGGRLLASILRRQDVETCFVSALGTRFGYAYRLSDIPEA